MGTSGFLAENSWIYLSRWGGSVFDETVNGSAEYRYNDFEDNNTSNFGSYCNGINVKGNPGAISMIGNTFDPYEPYCILP